MTEPVTYRLLLDNGGVIEGIRNGAFKYMSFAKRVELGQLSEAEKTEQLNRITNIYQRLSENAQPLTKCATSALEPPVAPVATNQNITAPVTSTRTAKPVKSEPIEKPAPLPARPKASASKMTSQPSLSKPPEPPQRSNPGRLSSSKKKALKVAIDTVWKADSFGIFKLPVTKRIAPDYYDIVKNPMDLKTVRQTLDKGAYEDEFAFKNDMDLIFYNCELYNGVQSEVGKHGVQVRKVWEKAWHQSGLDSGDARQSAHTKGSKRPPSGGDMQPAAKAARTGSTRTPFAPNTSMAVSSAAFAAPAPRPAQPQPQPAIQPRNQNSRGLSAAAPPVAARPISQGKFPETRSSALFEFIGNSDESIQSGVLEFLQRCNCNLPMDEDGEVELDPDALDDEVLWMLDEHIRTTSQGKYNPDAAIAEPVLALAGGNDEDTDDD